MGRLLPYRPESKPRADREPKVVDLTGEEADEVFEALASTTTRRILSLLYDEPRPASDLATEADTTLQNVRYHLEKLTDAGLIEEVDTWYSSTGNEMRVYAPTDTAVVLFMGDEGGGSIRQAITEFAGGIAVLGLAAMAMHRIVDPHITPEDDSVFSVATDDEPTQAPDAPEDTPIPDEAASPDLELGTRADIQTTGESLWTEVLAVLSEPGVLFFLGGLMILTLAVVIRYRQGGTVGR